MSDSLENDDKIRSNAQSSLQNAEETERSEASSKKRRYSQITEVQKHEAQNTFDTAISPEMTNVSAETSNERNKKMADDSKDFSSGANPMTTQDTDKDGNTSNHSDFPSIKTPLINESCNQQINQEAKSESETYMVTVGSPSIHSGDGNKTDESKDNSNEANARPTGHNPNISSDAVSNAFNIPLEAIPSTLLDAIRPIVGNRRLGLVYMTLEEVQRVRDRIIPIQTSHGPILFLPHTRQSPNTPHNSLEQLIQEHQHLSQEDFNVQHIISLFRRTPGMRMCRLKNRI